MAEVTLASYFNTHGAEIGFAPDSVDLERAYNFSANAAQRAFQSGELLQELVSMLDSARDDYAVGRPDLLFVLPRPTDLNIKVKPFASILSKIYRENYVHNRGFPNGPQKGFITGSNFYSRIYDILRTRIVCKYMDGPQFVVARLKGFCENKDLPFRSYPMASDRGYHAWHCYIGIPGEALVEGVLTNVTLTLEIQLTTQLAEVITLLTHGLYEGVREARAGKKDDTWRWEPQSQQFRSAYLGHTLHLLEGIIQTFKDEVLDVGAPSAESLPSTDDAGTAVAVKEA